MTICEKLRIILTPDIHMIPVKISYLLCGFLLGSHIPYLADFFTSVGLKIPQVGLIIGLRFVPAMVAGPLWGMLADYSGHRKLIMILLCIGSGVPLFLMPFVAHAIFPISRIVSPNETFPNLTFTGTSILGNVVQPHGSTIPLFWTLLFIIITGSIFVGPLPGYVDSMAMNVVKTGKTNATYGLQRIFGSIGFSLASVLASVAVDHYHNKWLSKYTAVFILFFTCAMALIPFGYYVVSQTRWDNDVTQNEDSQDKSGTAMVRKILGMCSQLDVIITMITVLISGLACNLFNSFGFKLAQGIFKDASKTQLSFIFVIATGAEVLLFPFTEKLIKILGSSQIAMTLGMFSYFLRYLIMVNTRQLWIMLSIQLLHAFGFALAWGAMMEYLHMTSPKDIAMSMFLIFQSIMFGVAALLANVMGGYIYDLYGGKKLFGGTSVLCGAWSVALFAYYGASYYRRKRRVRKSANMGEGQSKLGIDNVGRVVESEERTETERGPRQENV